VGRKPIKDHKRKKRGIVEMKTRISNWKENFCFVLEIIQAVVVLVVPLACSVWGICSLLAVMGK